ncbi:type II toxin-antitoxin system RelE/ParE family toxin [Candidatus Woesearchaeota archaeon]|nr:type II toxin-antitoxin system RelE/ParE family toxin [Candidatus Woesearchaeota archaeon]MBT6520088.1 type II toxin-antitoxin system RelE/ParE family toxin [Candidatus Woesearchaeota archaeon]MBT7366693.1 type II toxin-antitoxin system RelE/ParE family toxin [Candidatus Woesearchaeota archaeon]
MYSQNKFEIIFDRAAIEFLEKIEKKLAKRIWNKIMSTKENPHRFFDKLVERKDYKLRIGDYRVVADLNDKEKKIEITSIGHRKNIYKNI